MIKVICAVKDVPTGWEYKVQDSEMAWLLKKPGVTYPSPDQKVVARKPKVS